MSAKLATKPSRALALTLVSSVASSGIPFYDCDNAGISAGSLMLMENSIRCEVPSVDQLIKTNVKTFLPDTKHRSISAIYCTVLVHEWCKKTSFYFFESFNHTVSEYRMPTLEECKNAADTGYFQGN